MISVPRAVHAGCPRPMQVPTHRRKLASDLKPIAKELEMLNMERPKKDKFKTSLRPNTSLNSPLAKLPSNMPKNTVVTKVPRCKADNCQSSDTAVATLLIKSNSAPSARKTPPPIKEARSWAKPKPMRSMSSDTVGKSSLPAVELAEGTEPRGPLPATFSSSDTIAAQGAITATPRCRLVARWRPLLADVPFSPRGGRRRR
mmetsp:Transcript_7004/g.19880  ORF Transcript_7004/g.19880 Transcript_7004/m.19880 type:complete len:201 (-) Transcript_7004:165-767(-)